MKKLTSILIAAMILVTLTACDAPGVYKFDDILPPLMDITTQYPYVTSIDVIEEATGVTKSFTQGTDLDNIRMRLEGIKGIREKDKGDHPVVYSVIFNTTDGKITIGIASEKDFIIDGYYYDAMYSGADVLYFSSMFSEE